MNEPLNGTKRQGRTAMGNLAWVFRDLVALVELQGLLIVADAGAEFRKMRNGLVLFALLAVLGASCLPIGLAGLALVLAEATSLTAGQSLLCVAACGLIVAGVGACAAIRAVKPGPDCLRRSRAEWRCNVDWLKETLHNLGHARKEGTSHEPRP